MKKGRDVQCLLFFCDNLSKLVLYDKISHSDKIVSCVTCKTPRIADCSTACF